MKDLLHRTTPRLGLLVLLAAALGCLFFLFELFVGLTSSGGNDLSAESSSLGPSFEVPSGASLMTVLAAVTCIALGAAALLLLRRWLKDRPGTPRWVMVCGGAPAVAVVGLGIYLLVSGTTHGSLPYGSIPYGNYQVNAGGMKPLVVTVLAIVVLAVVLVGVMKPRMLILLLAMCLVSILMLGAALFLRTPGPEPLWAPFTDVWAALVLRAPGPEPLWGPFTIAAGGRLHRGSQRLTPARPRYRTVEPGAGHGCGRTPGGGSGKWRLPD